MCFYTAQNGKSSEAPKYRVVWVALVRRDAAKTVRLRGCAAFGETFAERDGDLGGGDAVVRSELCTGGDEPVQPVGTDAGGRRRTDGPRAARRQSQQNVVVRQAVVRRRRVRVHLTINQSIVYFQSGPSNKITPSSAGSGE